MSWVGMGTRNNFESNSGPSFIWTTGMGKWNAAGQKLCSENINQSTNSVSVKMTHLTDPTRDTTPVLLF